MDINKQIGEARNTLYEIDGPLASPEAMKIENTLAAIEQFISQQAEEIERLTGLYEEERALNSAIGVERELWEKGFEHRDSKIRVAIHAFNQLRECGITGEDARDMHDIVNDAIGKMLKLSEGESPC